MPFNRTGFFPAFIAACLCATPVSARAAETAMPPSLLESGIEAGDRTREFVSERFVAMIRGVDRFFGDERNFQESNESVLQLGWNELLEPGGERRGRLSGRAKLHLPAISQRIQLVLESDPVQSTATPGSNTSPTDQPQAIGQSRGTEKQGVALRFQHQRAQQEATGWRLYSDVGFQVRSPLRPFVRSRASFVLPFENWQMNTTESLFWFNGIGPGAGALLDFDRPLAAQLLFRASSNATWFDRPQRLDLRQDFILFHTLDERSALQYQAGVIGTTQPATRVEDCIVSVLYRRQLHRKWLFFELNPQLHFPHEQQFHFTPQLWLRLQVLFSKG